MKEQGWLFFYYLKTIPRNASSLFEPPSYHYLSLCGAGRLKAWMKLNPIPMLLIDDVVQPSTSKYPLLNPCFHTSHFLTLNAPTKGIPT